jgi:hypothetical protein
MEWCRISLLLRCFSQSKVWIRVTPFTECVKIKGVLRCLVVSRFIGWFISNCMNWFLGFL